MTQRIHTIRLVGDEPTLGAQHGAIVQELGGRDDLAGFYPGMAGRLLSIKSPQPLRAPLRAVLQPVLAAQAGRLHKARQQRFPELVRRSEQGIRAAGLPPGLARWLTVMDVFQNTVGHVASLRMPGLTGLRPVGVGMCSSLAVWGRASADTSLRHARNFDFPGIGVWDAAPTVVFCRPISPGALRYGFVTSLGVDLPGVTGFNEAGITVTAHTRIHMNVDADGVSIGDLGHELVRSCRTLNEAIATARALGSSSTWGLLVSSAAERDAVLIETTGKAVRITRPGADHHLACTNRYRHPELARGEILTSPVFALDSDARFATLEAAAARGGLTADELQELLATAVDPSAATGTEAEHITGSCIASPLTVQSVVVEPEQGRVRVASGRAPTARGPWTVVPWAWDGPAGVVATEEVAVAAPVSGLDRATADYTEAVRLDVDGAPAARMRARLHAAAAAAPREPQLQFLGALAALNDGDLDLAEDRLERGISVQTVPWRRAQLLRWSARVAEARGHLAGARERRSQVDELGHGARHVREEVAADRRRPSTAASLRRVVPDTLLVDG